MLSTKAVHNAHGECGDLYSAGQTMLSIKVHMVSVLSVQCWAGAGAGGGAKKQSIVSKSKFRLDSVDQ